MPQKGIHCELDISEVELDIDNPRIKKWLEIYSGTPTADQIYLALKGPSSSSSSGGTTFLSLKESIRSNGGIIHPIISNNTGNKKVVIDGNTRLYIYKEFHEKKQIGTWNKIPSLLYDNLSNDEINAIRLQAHLVGPRPWDPYSKAKFLHHLRTFENMPYQRMIDYCGGNAKTVANLIEAYEDMEMYYRPILDSDEGEEFDTTRFSAFDELQRANIKDTILEAGFNLSDFSRWVADRLIQPLNTVRQLPKILRNNTAKKVFLNEGAKEAIKTIDIQNAVPDLIAMSLIDLSSALRRKLDVLTHKEAMELQSSPESEEAQAILDLNDELQLYVQYIKGEEE
jgi:hypothetical protein